jgi:hypothetical protein
MKATRLHGLLVVMTALVAVRAWDLRRTDKAAVLAEAVLRPVAASASASSLPMAARERPGVRERDEAEPRNAFAVRVPPAPPPLPPAPPVVVPKPFVGPPLPPPPPPPAPPPPSPFQVVGTWTDDKGLSVFLAGPRSTLQARSGDVLMNEYRVTRLTTQEVVIHQIASGQDWRLALPMSASNRP